MFPPGAIELSFDEGASDTLRQAVLEGLAEAPALLSDALQMAPPRRPYQRVELALRPGAGTQGEAVAVGPGSIRLLLGRETRGEDARRIARHEALHLLLASALEGGERWTDPEIAFADWIVRGIESGLSAPRFGSPLPEILTRLPRSRGEVEKQLEAPSARTFGEPLAQALLREQGRERRLWLVEAALGVHHLEAAARLGEGGLRAVILDDWLLDYEQYARAVGNAPADAGNLWRLEDPGWSRDPLVRLSVAAQALQRDDRAWFDAAAEPAETWVWKNRGRVRLPLLHAPEGPRPPPLRSFRAACDAGVIDDAARGDARNFEARALWPRILARLLAQGARPPPLDPESAPLVQIADSSAAIWEAAAERLRQLLPDHAAWVPRIAEPRDEVAGGLLVFGAPPSPETVAASRRLAAHAPVRGAVFRGTLGGGRAWERLPDLDAPLDPRYRDDIWDDGPLPQTLHALVGHVDEATREGRLATPLAHLFSIMSFGVDECVYPRQR